MSRVDLVGGDAVDAVVCVLRQENDCDGGGGPACGCVVDIFFEFILKGLLNGKHKPAFRLTWSW